MRKLALSLVVALIALLPWPAGTFAQVVPGQMASPGSWQAPPSSTLIVMARDFQVAAQADQAREFVQGLVSEWRGTFGWTQSAPIYVLVYRSGIVMASDVGWFRVLPLNAAELADADSRIGFTVRDARPIGPGGGTGGWIITLNANFGHVLDKASANPQASPSASAPGALSREEQGFLAHELAGIMLQDLTGAGGPDWLRAGVTDLIMNSEVQGLVVSAARQEAVTSAAASGTLPGPVALTNSWVTLSMGSGPVANAAYGVADETTTFLVNKVGLLQVLDILRRTSAGEDFDTVLKSTTGYSLPELDTAMGGTLARHS